MSRIPTAQRTRLRAKRRDTDRFGPVRTTVTRQHESAPWKADVIELVRILRETREPTRDRCPPDWYLDPAIKLDFDEKVDVVQRRAFDTVNWLQKYRGQVEKIGPGVPVFDVLKEHAPTVERHVAGGGNGDVFLSVDRETGAKTAIKVHYPHNRRSLEAVYDEMHVAAAINDAIVAAGVSDFRDGTGATIVPSRAFDRSATVRPLRRVLDFAFLFRLPDNRMAYAVATSWPWVEGVTMRDHLRNLAEAGGSHVAEAVTRAAVHAEAAVVLLLAAGFVHNDFKDDNIMLHLDENGMTVGATVLDMGFATCEYHPQAAAALLGWSHVDGFSYAGMSNAAAIEERNQEVSYDWPFTMPATRLVHHAMGIAARIQGAARTASLARSVRARLWAPAVTSRSYTLPFEKCYSS